MSGTSHRAADPLYILIMRNNPGAEAAFRNWIRTNRIENATVSGSRMMLHDQLSFEMFKVTWLGNITNITIWDTWSKRHIYLD
jgi:hypothetical protein